MIFGQEYPFSLRLLVFSKFSNNGQGGLRQRHHGGVVGQARASQRIGRAGPTCRHQVEGHAMLAVLDRAAPVHGDHASPAGFLHVGRS
jgi:hypothetical protein